MIYTKKIKGAIKFATKTHEIYQKQTRKGKDIAYITHPLTVGLILALARATEDVIVAGILHDTIEDSPAVKKVTPEMLVERFGQNVTDLVLSVTEQDKALSWEERKRDALEHIKTFSHDALLVKSADTISNVSEILDDYGRLGEKVFASFNAPKEKTIKNNLEVIRIVLEYWTENPLVEDLRSVARDLQPIGAGKFKSATIIKYEDYNEDIPLLCPACGWKGTPKESGWINTDSHYVLDVSCPNCEKMLLVAGYPIVK